MDLLRELGELAIASRFRRLSENLMKGVNDIYREQGWAFRARWFPVLYLLKDQKPMPITTIAHDLSMTHPAVNQIAGIMIKNGLVKASPGNRDRRQRLLTLTTKGRRLAADLAPTWEDVRATARDVLESTGHDVLAMIEAMEQALDEKSMYLRIKDRRKARQCEEVEIVDYRPHLKRHFRALNYEWLREFFAVEPFDEAFLSDPQRNIIKPGGRVFFARLEGHIVGTAALIRHSEDACELAKMGVTASARGKQAGRKLALAVIERARAMGASTLVLETSPQLTAALALYRGLGFKVVPGSEVQHLASRQYARVSGTDDGEPHRTSIVMKLSLKPNPKNSSKRRSS